ncbi:Tubulin polyglutamylase TTLL13 [Galemys pyrenaicus]|uniref:Tubulin polyglutamylase TTLL13 n=1 Tax=Galemys pyrenaicus TaxID=202257 RepID=A0A8J6DS55_GALPY|nr:Tubulin polyglutamylase TTLL13 [Galemys pyrenaicus]
MEPSTCKASESEDDLVGEDSEEECVKGEAPVPSAPPRPDLAKADCKGPGSEAPSSSSVAKKVPKKSIGPLDSEDLETGRRKRRRKRRPLAINLTNCKYESVRRAAQLCGLKEVGEDEEWTVYWTDCSVSLERVMDMKRFQKINHFPGMTEICRKDLLARNLNRMQKLYPAEYSIFPRTWCLPADYGDFQAYGRQRKTRAYICKPDSGCQGRGIFITRNPREIKAGEHMICQQYISKPFLIDGFKFDMRIYVLITSCDPLRIFMYEEGLARFATMPYVEPSHGNLDDVCMHLTNYAINKHNENFVRDEAMGSKRKLSTLNAWLREHSYDARGLWRDIEDIIIKTVISAHSVLRHNYRTCFPQYLSGGTCACFEILGFDILLDHKMKPWLLEVNHSPSFTTDSRLDREVKDALLCDAMTLVNLRGCDKRKVMEEDKRRVKERLFQCHQQPREARREQMESSRAAMLDQERYEDSHLGGYRRIYPGSGTEKYAPFFKHNGSLFQETAASKAREECARCPAPHAPVHDGEACSRTAAHLQQGREEARPVRRKAVAPSTSSCHPLPAPLPSTPPQRLQLLCLARQQLEEIRLKQQQQELSGCKRRRENREQSQGESAGEKSGSRAGLRSLSIHLAYRNRDQEKEVSPAPLDTMQPQAIVEEEELERMKALLQRENLIRSLGIVEQLTRMLHPGHRGQKKLPESRPKSFNWIEDPAASGSYPVSVKKAGSRYFPSARVRLASQGQASRRLEAINRALAGSVPPSLTPKQGYLLQPERVASGSWTECTVPSVADSEHRADKAQNVTLCPGSAPLLQRPLALLDIRHHRLRTKRSRGLMPTRASRDATALSPGRAGLAVTAPGRPSGQPRARPRAAAAEAAAGGDGPSDGARLRVDPDFVLKLCLLHGCPPPRSCLAPLCLAPVRPREGPAARARLPGPAGSGDLSALPGPPLPAPASGGARGAGTAMAGALGRLLGGRVRAAVTRCGLATRGSAGAGPTGREPDPESDWEPEERALQEVASALKRQKKAIRLQKIRRQMEPPGAPPRTLTWEAMEQIRYLHKEFADSWSVPQLAGGFDVSTDVIRRVLKSKFVPTLEQRQKQDQKALKKAGLAPSLRQLQGCGAGAGATSKPLSAGCPGSALLTSGHDASSEGRRHDTALNAINSNSSIANAPGRPTGRARGIQVLTRERLGPEPAHAGGQREVQRLSIGTGTAGTGRPGLPGDQKLEKRRVGEPGDQNFSSKVVRRGREFYDDNGNFLYRI